MTEHHSLSKIGDLKYRREITSSHHSDSQRPFMSFVTRRIAATFVYPLAILIALTIVLPHQVAFSQEENAAAAKPAAEAGEHPPAQKMSTLAWLIHTSGWIGFVLFVMSIYLVAKITQLFMRLRPQNIMPEDLLEEWGEMLNKRDYQGIYRTAKESDSELGMLVANGITSLNGGLAEARDSIDRHGELVAVEMEKQISMLAVIGSLGPLIGLLGTLKGMIASFSVIAMSETQMKASEVAGGISEALLITFEGVALSVPAIFFFALFRNRVATLSLGAVSAANELIRRIQNTASSRPAATT